MPVNQRPWLDAQTQVSGTSHHRGRRSSAVRQEAPTQMASMIQLTSCGRSSRLPKVPVSAAIAMMSAGTVSATWRVHQRMAVNSSSIATQRSQATAGSPNHS